MRIGLLGGSFNPPHNGHLAMSRAAGDARNLDEVRLLVAARPPHKNDIELGDFHHRMAMARLVAQELPFLKASDIEARLPGVSYTFRTLEVLKENQPDGEFFFIMGADTVPEFTTWKNPRRILELASPVVIPRTGFSVKDVEKLRDTLSGEPLEALRKSYLNVEPIDISSTMIRELAHRGEDFGHTVPETVARYIREQELYR